MYSLKLMHQFINKRQMEFLMQKMHYTLTKFYGPSRIRNQMNKKKLLPTTAISARVKWC